MFTLIDCGSNERYVVPAKSADESTIRLLLADRQQESLTVYTDGLRTYDPLEGDDIFTWKYVVHSGSECADSEIYINTCEATKECQKTS